MRGVNLSNGNLHKPAALDVYAGLMIECFGFFNRKITCRDFVCVACTG